MNLSNAPTLTVILLNNTSVFNVVATIYTEMKLNLSILVSL